MATKSWRRFRPESNEELEAAFNRERHLTALWYQRISGNVGWLDGERERLSREMDAATAAVHLLMAEQSAERFAQLPDPEV